MFLLWDIGQALASQAVWSRFTTQIPDCFKPPDELLLCQQHGGNEASFLGLCWTKAAKIFNESLVFSPVLSSKQFCQASANIIGLWDKPRALQCHTPICSTEGPEQSNIGKFCRNSSEKNLCIDLGKHLSLVLACRRYSALWEMADAG